MLICELQTFENELVQAAKSDNSTVAVNLVVQYEMVLQQGIETATLEGRLNDHEIYAASVRAGRRKGGSWVIFLTRRKSQPEIICLLTVQHRITKPNTILLRQNMDLAKKLSKSCSEFEG